MTEKTLRKILNQETLRKVLNAHEPPSELMTEIYKALLKIHKDGKTDLKRLNPFYERLVTPTPSEQNNWVYDKTIHIYKCEGEWTVHRYELRFWGDLRSSARYYSVEDMWNWMTSLITEKLHELYTYQIYKRYVANGRAKPEHKKLLAAMCWDWNLWYGDGACIFVGGKRPFGNSNIEYDICHKLDWDYPNADNLSEDEYTKQEDEIGAKAMELYDELQFAIVDILSD